MATADDHVHPSLPGYEAMANQYADYLIDYLSPEIRDQFQYAAASQLTGQGGWTASTSLLIRDTGESPGGALYCDSEDQSWNHVAIWNTSQGLNSASIRIHGSSESNVVYNSAVGILVGMNGTNITDPVIANRPGGYMVFVHLDGRAEVYVWDGARGADPIGAKVGQATMASMVPGDILNVTYEKATGTNTIFVSKNGGIGVPIVPTIQLLNSNTDYYTGIVFRGVAGARTALMLDYFEVDNKRVDLIPPGQITLSVLGAAATNSTITLNWAAVGDDGGTNAEEAASSYDLRYSMLPITNEDDFDAANIVPGVSPPKAPGTTESVTIKGLLAGASYYFAIKVSDDYGNKSTLSDDVIGSTTSERTSTETFANLNNWKLDPTEYGIDGNGDFVNRIDQSGSDRWGSLAIYKTVRNPNMVKMVWGSSTTNPIRDDGDTDTDELEAGGIILMASDTTLQASGYLVFIRTLYQKIYLFDTYWDQGVNARRFSFIDATSYDLEGLGRLPGANDTLAVVADISEETYTKFDVYVGLNGNPLRPASRISLFDTRPAAQRRGLDGVHYAGLMMTRYASTSGRDGIGIKRFYTTSPQAGIAGLAALSPTSGLTGVVDTALPDSVRVRVEDLNGLPVQGVPVFFNVASGGGQVSTPYAQDGRIRLEAEWGNPVAPMIAFTDATASGGKYIASIQHGGDVRGYTTYTFKVNESGNYYYWGRVKNISYSASRYVLGFELVGEDPPGDGITWEVLKNEAITGDWQWDAVQVNTSSQPHSHFLEAGTHVIKVYTAHRDVWLDKLVITRDPPTTWQPTGTEASEAKLSNADGEAAVAWRLGQVADDLGTAQNEGANTLEAWSFGSDGTLTFSATASAGAAATIVDQSGTLQGTSGETLTLRVGVFDVYDNKKANQNVTFVVTQGDGSLVTGHDQRVTDNNGEATAQVVLGAEDSVKIQAYFDAAGPKVTLTAYVTQGNVGSLTNQSTNRKLHVDSTYTNYLRVLVKDNTGAVVTTSLPVQFVVQDNIGTKVNGASSATVWTDVNGIAVANLVTGAQAGIAHVIARSSGRQVTVAQDSVFYLAAHMSKPAGSGGQEQLSPGQLSYYPIKVFVSNGQWNAVRNHPVRFAITNTESGFTFESSGATVVEKVTDNNGFAQIKVRAGQLHGSESAYQNIVTASSDNGFGKPIPSPQNFTFFVKSDAFELVKQSAAQDTVGVVTEMVGPLMVQLRKADGQPLGGQRITFERMSGNGSFNPETALSKKVVVADANGYASTNFWLGTFAGPDSNRVRVYTENYDSYISTDFNLLAQSSVGDVIAAVGPVALTGQVGSAQVVTVKVRDQGGNPVGNEKVHFAIVQGKNAVVGNGTADVTKDVVTNSQGEASVTWTLGTEAGAGLNRLEASAHNGNYTLKGSPVAFMATTMPGDVSRTHSVVEATGPVMVGPEQSSEISVYLKDKYDNAVPSVPVEIVVLGGSNNFPSKQTVQSNAQGLAQGFLYSTSAGERTIKAVVNGDTLNSTATVIFMAGNATQLVEYTGNDQTGNINTVLKDPFVVRVTDADGNPVAYGPVYFNVYGGAGEVIEDQPVVTDANGFARAHFKLGSTLGRYAALQVSSPTLANKPTFWVTGTNNSVYAMWYPDGYDSEVEGAAGQPSPPLTVLVTDVNGKPINGERVTFTVNPDEGSNGAMIGSSTVTSDMYGHATAYFRMDSRAGFESWIYAENQSATGKVWFKATSVAGSALRLSAVGSTQLTGQIIGTTIQLKVKATDAFDNAIGGVVISFQRLTGDAQIVGATQVTTGSNGEAAISLQLGTQAGVIRVQATAALEGSPVVFDIVSQTSEQNASNLVRLPQGVTLRHGTVNRYLPDSLYARVVDNYGNPVANQPVLFRDLASGSGGLFSGDGREYTDSRGVVSVAFRCGPTVGVTHRIEARWGIKAVTFDILTHSNASFPVLDKDYINSIYTGIEEGSDLWIDLRASDADGDALSFEIGGVDPPDGAYIDPVAGQNRATFKWTPDYNQGRSEAYDLVLRVVDGKGGFDEKAIKVFVQNLNQLPRIEAVSPSETDVSIASGQTAVFEVHAIDPDGDPLVYTWLVNGQAVSNNSAVYHHKTSKLDPPGTYIIDVLVSDGPFTVTHRWSLIITDAVQLAGATADFMAADGTVRLVWFLSPGAQRVGFDIYRGFSRDGAFSKVSETAVVPAEDGQYIFMDAGVQAGRTYYYMLVDQGEEPGSGHVVIAVCIPTPQSFELMQNYPNPFNPSTRIRYQIPKPGRVTLTIYNMMGQVVRTLVDEGAAPGFYTQDWDGRDNNGRETATGLYFYRLESDGQVQIRRMIKLH